MLTPIRAPAADTLVHSIGRRSPCGPSQSGIAPREMSTTLGPFSFERVILAMENVRRRLVRTAEILRSCGVPYAIVGGNAVALWVSRVDESAVRNTQDVDVLLRRADFPAAKRALESAGFVHRHLRGVEVFLDGPDARPRDAVHVIFANEKVRPEEPLANPDVDESEASAQFRVISLAALVRIKLTAFRDKDRTHLRDLIDVGLVDQSTLAMVPEVLAGRLRMLLETPDG